MLPRDIELKVNFRKNVKKVVLSTKYYFQLVQKLQFSWFWPENRLFGKKWKSSNISIYVILDQIWHSEDPQWYLSSHTYKISFFSIFTISPRSPFSPIYRNKLGFWCLGVWGFVISLNNLSNSLGKISKRRANN